MKSTISPEPALLGFLRDSPLHGYDLHKQVNANLGAVWRIGLSQMYAILKEYEARGWIHTVVAPQKGRPARKMMKLTPSGRRAFDAWMRQSARGVREFRVDFFARLYFARAAGEPALHAFLEQQLDATRHDYDALIDAPASADFADIVRSFRRAQLETTLDWMATLQSAQVRRTDRRLSKRVSRKKM